MPETSDVLRYVAFSERPDGGNPAGVVLDAAGLSDAEMLKIAADVGYSETAFLDGDDIRYFSPLAEMPFCGHATVATAVALAERDGPGELRFNTPVGPVPIVTRRNAQGQLAATLTTTPRVEELAAGDLEELLAALRWEPSDLDPALPPHVSIVGGGYPVIAAASRERLADLDYDFDRLGALMRARVGDDPARMARGADALPRAQPVPARRHRRGSRDRGGRGRARRLPARARPRRAAGDGHRPPGRAPRAPGPADRRHPRRPAADRPHRHRRRYRLNSGRTVATTHRRRRPAAAPSVRVLGRATIARPHGALSHKPPSPAANTAPRPGRWP